MLEWCEHRLDHLSEDPDRVAMWALARECRWLAPGENPCIGLDEYCTWKFE
jgi:hypothetical protein